METKQPIIDWLLIFFMTAYLANLIDAFLVLDNRIEYPVRFFPEVFKNCVLFDLWVLPIINVFYNQTSYRSKRSGIILQAFLYSTPMVLLEYWLEKNTRLIVYHNWGWIQSYLSLILMLLFVRGSIALIRKFSKYSRCTIE
jgi:hypothetical protein